MAATRFIAYEDVAQVLARGTTRSSVVLRNGLQVNLRVVSEVNYGAALMYFTGSKAHNIALRGIAAARGLKLNEYGLFEGTRRTAAKTEEEVYRGLDLPYIEPELREDHGEIEAARQGKLPHLVTLAYICGDLHAHTTESDGHRDLVLYRMLIVNKEGRTDELLAAGRSLYAQLEAPHQTVAYAALYSTIRAYPVFTDTYQC